MDIASFAIGAVLGLIVGLLVGYGIRAAISDARRKRAGFNPTAC
jgi:NhaP-type Na+/H+ or K+/H+ antiporter